MTADDWIKVIRAACGYDAFGSLINCLSWCVFLVGIAAIIRAYRK